MTEERNALAELANELNWIKNILRTERYTNFCEEVDKAQRIIAELAKVRWWRSMSGWMPRGSDVSKILVTCRAIAEEGMKE